MSYVLCEGHKDAFTTLGRRSQVTVCECLTEWALCEEHVNVNISDEIIVFDHAYIKDVDCQGLTRL